MLENIQFGVHYFESSSEVTSRYEFLIIVEVYFVHRLPVTPYCSTTKKKSAVSQTNTVKITLVNTQNVSVNKIFDSSSIQFAETKYGLRIQLLALVVMIHEVWLNA